jgi:hypothetical protein
MDGWDRVKQAMVVGLGFWDHVKQATVIWLRRFCDGVKGTWFRILAGLFIALVVVAAGYWARSTWESWRIEEMASLSKTWPASRIPGDENGTVEITTKCSDSKLSYTVAIVPPKSDAGLTQGERTERGRVVTEQIRKHLKGIRLQFVDKEGSPIAAHDLAMDEFVRIYYSSDERPTSLEARGTLACNLARYVRAEALTLSWIEWPE